MPLSQRRARLLKRLGSSRTRAREGLVLVEGVRAVDEALEGGASVSFAVVSPAIDSTEAGRALRRRLDSALDRADIVEVSDDDLGKVADTEQPQGVLVVCAEPETDLETELTAASRVLVLDAVQDPGNVGTLVRSAVAFGFDLVVSLDGTADPLGPKSVRASAGMVFRIALVRCRAEEAVAAFLGRGLPILVASTEGSIAVDRPTGDFALVLGNEGSGVRPLLRDAAASTVAVLMSGPAESLNVGIAGSILMSDFTRPGR